MEVETHRQPFKCSPSASMDSPVLCSLAISPSGEPLSPAVDSPETAVVSPASGGWTAVGMKPPVSPTIDSKSMALETHRGTGASRGSESNAAVKVQKVYRSYRTRRRLADSAVVAEELWWQAIDFARLNHSTISFFDFQKPESAASRWNRISLNASKVGKGLSKDDKAQILAFRHWIEAIDPRHRYGHSLHLYYEAWRKADSGQPFFLWLDIGDGIDVELKECPRSRLRQQCIKYLGPKERELYEYIVVEGRIVHKLTGDLLDTSEGSEGAKWIFVMSTCKKLYASKKKKGVFHHSSFLAGGSTLAAGRLVADHGLLKSISPYSGHYRPTDGSLENFISFLKENGVNIDEVQILSANEDYENSENGSSAAADEIPAKSEASRPAYAQSSEPSEVTPAESKDGYRRSLSGGLQSPRANVPKNAILNRINSKKAARSYQLGHQVSLKWSTGVGPRIGCVADYPKEVRVQALEFVNLSPRAQYAPSPGSSVGAHGLPSPAALSPWPGSSVRAHGLPSPAPLTPSPGSSVRAHGLPSPAAADDRKDNASACI